MIELELKYAIKRVPNVIKKLEIIKEKQQEDIYYDTPNYDLIRRGNFLRIRDGKRLEFKLFAGDTSHLFCQETDFNLDELSKHRDEINSILSSIHLSPVETLRKYKQIIDYNSLQVLAPILKHRISYKFDECTTISIDEVDDLGLYIENEIMIDADSLLEEEAQQVKTDLILKLQKSGILTGEEELVNIGYVELYLLKNNVKAYKLGLYKK